MKFVIVFVTVLFVLNGAGSAQNFHLPEMYYSDSGVLNRPFAKDPKLVFFNGKYFMYYSLPGVGLKHWYIGIAQSDDLIHWKKVGELKPEQPVEMNGICAPGAIVKEGKLELFYQTYGTGIHDAICHATSVDGIHFEKDSTNPVFRPNGRWTCGRAIDAEVVLFKGQYFLYYATRDSAYKIQQQGVAVTTLHSDFSRGTWKNLSTDSAILKPTLDWERNCIEAASCIVRDSVLYMFYAGGYNNEPQQIGVAKSLDGFRWERLYNQPILSNGVSGSWNSSESGHPDIFRDQRGMYHLFFQGNSDKGTTWYISKVEIGWNQQWPIISDKNR